jgi:hypothetical protein
MMARRILQVPVGLLTGFAALLDAQPQPTPAAGGGTVGVTAVCSRVSKDYIRVKFPDGSFQPEEYVLAKGGRLEGPFRDASIDNVKFMEITQVLTGPLAAQSYIAAKKLDTEKLIIMVYWGTTRVPTPLAQWPEWGLLGNQLGRNDFNDPNYGSHIANILNSEVPLTRQTDFRNALLLGYPTDVSMSAGLRDDLLSELEDNRYFVVLLAFDFQTFRTEKKHKLLWETRFSIDESRNFFDKSLPVMAQYASAYFGQDSHGLVRTKVPEGRVLIGEPKSLGEVEAVQK